MPDPPFDPDKWLQENRPTRGKARFDPDKWLTKHPTSADDDNESVVSRVMHGVDKGLLAPVVGAGQIAEDIFPETAARVKAIPGVGSIAHAAKEYALAPNKTWAETAGNVVGTAAPFVAGGSGAAGPIARTALGLAGGAVQPTESGSLGSHALNAATGAVTGGLTTPPVAGRAAQAGVAGLTYLALDQLARVTGRSPIELLAEIGGAGYFAGLPALARRAGRSVVPVGRAIGRAIPAGAAGAVAGPAASQYLRPLLEDGDAE